MRTSLGFILVAASLASCDPDPAAPGSTLRITIAEQRSDGSRMGFIPWIDGGRVSARVTLSVGNFVGAIPVRVSLINTTIPDAGSTVQSTLLTRLTTTGNEYAAPVAFAWPTGGDFTLRAEAAGIEQDFPFTMDVPKIGLSPTVTEPDAGTVTPSDASTSTADGGTSTADASTPTLHRYRLCVETSARSGTLILQVRRGHFAGDATQLTQPLEQGACTMGAPLFAGELEHTRLPVEVIAENREFLLTARLDGQTASIELPLQ